MTFLEFFILGLAAWRLASMVVRERGPWDMFVWARERAGIVHDEDKIPTVYPDKFFAQLLSCTWCFSMWVGTFWIFMYLLIPPLTIAIAAVFALSTAAIVIDRWLGN